MASGVLSFSSFEKKISEHNPINPWIELSKEAYLKNAAEISKMAQGKPVLAVLKNNAYGLGDVEVGQILDTSPHISGIALVKEERALALRNAGVKKPILLMADFNDNRGKALIESGISLSVHSYDSLKKIQQASKGTSSIAKVEIYVDTGLGRMGMPYYLARDLVRKVAEDGKLQIVGIFTTLTTPPDFAKEQLKRFAKLIKDLKKDGIETGTQHAAPSSSLLDIPAAHLDQVRPGILLHGSFPLVNSSASKSYTLHPTFKLKARVIRVEKLRKGDSVGFSRFYTAPKDEWIATIPIGWADGYDSGSENGAKVLVGGRLYPVINVNASHCNLLLNSRGDIRVGEVATMIGPDLPEITPEGFAKSIKGHNYLQIQYKESIPKYVQENFE
ncbi:MAG: alanine racemase [Bacteroidota bacterium]